MVALLFVVTTQLVIRSFRATTQQRDKIDTIGRFKAGDKGEVSLK